MLPFKDKRGPLTSQEIRNFLPHREPFLFLDEVISIDIPKTKEGDGILVGSKVHAAFTFRESEEFFKGHFPSYPITPGVLIIESLGQAGIFCIYPFTRSRSLVEDNDFLKLVGINGVRFRHPVLPNDRVDLFVELKNRKKNIWKFTGCAKVKGTLITEAELTASYELKENTT